ncbi:MAG TPA: NAD(P)/FAD-dependent oxidoreductase [Candidatus Limnocylindrales bacterium]|nr:NAD(P)/FAD-dependent oxidoreductase [Candidatus Limnocylindrales bacterium]
MKWDVAILGGGFAGQLLARQLTRQTPGLRIAVFEKSTGTSFKVGEATVEIAANYLVRRQGLLRYLYDRHYPKNGLRYFFDNPQKSAPLQSMSEIGPINFPFHAAFQIDRARIESDLREMNAEAGVEVRTGVRALPTDVRDDGGLHTITVESASGSEVHEARWVVDAAGRADLLARAKGLRVRENEHRLGAVWGRFENVVDIDSLGPDSFHERVRHATRGLSTVHFWYPGYWIWFIPLRDGITSVGVVGHPVTEVPGIRTIEGFRKFLDTHGAVRMLLAGSRPVDVGSYSNMAYNTSQFFSTGRWGLVGEAATSADALYSPGSDFIAIENDMLADLIARDAGGEPAAELAERTRLYNEFMQFRQEATLNLYRGQYSTFGSFELTRMKWDLDIGSYFNLWVTAYMQDQHLDRTWLRSQLRMRPLVLQALVTFGDLFREIAQVLREEGRFYSKNLGQFSYGLERIDFVPEVGLPRSRRRVLEKQTEIFNSVRRSAAELLGRPGDPDVIPSLPLSAFVGNQPIL